VISITNAQRATTFEILALGEMLPQYDGVQLAHETIRERGGVESLMRKISAKVAREPLTKAADRILGFDPVADSNGYSLARALKAAAERNWDIAPLERSISDLVSTRTGNVANGFYVPLSLLARGFSSGTAGEAGNMISPEVYGGMASDPLRKHTAVASLGATMLSGLTSTLEIPVFNYSNDAPFLTEINAAPEYLESTAQVALTPRRVSVYMQPSRQAILQADPALDVTLGRHLIRGIMEQIEALGLNGDGASPNPYGVRNTAGVGSIVGGTNGAQLSFAHLADMEHKPGQANINDGAFSGYLVNSETRRWLRTTQRATGLPFIWEGGERALLGHRAAVSQLMPSNLTKGTANGVCSALTYSADWSQMIVGIYGAGVDLVVDRITLANQGLIRITAIVYVGIGFTRPAAFSVMNDALTA